MEGNKKQYHRILLLRMQSSMIGHVKHPQHVYPPLALKYVEALIHRKGGYETKLIDTWLSMQEDGNLIEKVRAWVPDVIVVLANPVDSQAAFDFGTELKKQYPCFLVAVGQEVVVHPERFLSPTCPFDVALPGESEVEVLSAIEKLNDEGAAKAKAFYRPSDGLKPFVIDDLENLPFPSYEPDEIEGYCFSSYPLRMKQQARWGFVLSSRGCPYGCYFCSPIMRKTYGERFRGRTAQNIVDEIEHLMKLGINVISFEDDDITAKRDHALSLCREIKKRGIKVNWICHARVDELDAGLLKEMKDAGCLLLRIGVESGSDRVLQLFRKNPKGRDWKKTCRAIFEEARRLGIATNALVIIGNPEETREEVEGTIDFVVSLNPDMIQVHFFTLYPGSPAYEDYKNLVSEDQVSAMHHYNLPVVNLSRLSSEELWRLRGKFYKKFFFRPSFVFPHLYRYLPFYLHNPKVFRQLSKVTGIL